MLITKVRHSCVIIETSEHNIYLDPYLDPLLHTNLPKADLILISNPEYDHGTQQSVNMISNTDTRVYGTPAAGDDINLEPISPGDTRSAGNSRLQVIHTTHPELETQGYLIEADSQSILYTGDTTLDNALRSHVCSVLILPITTGLMSEQEQLTLIEQLKPRIVIPVHFGTLTGSISDALALKRTVEEQTGSKVIVLDDGESVEI